MSDYQIKFDLRFKNIEYSILSWILSSWKDGRTISVSNMCLTFIKFFWRYPYVQKNEADLWCTSYFISKKFVYYRSDKFEFLVFSKWYANLKCHFCNFFYVLNFSSHFLCSIQFSTNKNAGKISERKPHKKSHEKWGKKSYEHSETIE